MFNWLYGWAYILLYMGVYPKVYAVANSIGLFEGKMLNVLDVCFWVMRFMELGGLAELFICW